MRLNKELADLKNEVAKFRNETNQRLDLIEHELNKYVALNYVRAVVDYMSYTTTNFIKSLKCPENREEELECKEEFIQVQQKYIDKLKLGRLSESNKALIKTIDWAKEDEQRMLMKGKEACASCYRELIDMLSINKSLFDELQVLTEPSTRNEEKLEIISLICPSELEETVLSPISHEARLQIMLSIFKGNGRFADFIASTNLNGGHLLYHVNRLIKHRFVQKYSSKEYRLTKKGIKTLLLLAELQKETTLPTLATQNNST
jgi:DNA-binding HxlR family transcriptional regulator